MGQNNESAGRCEGGRSEDYCGAAQPSVREAARRGGRFRHGWDGGSHARSPEEINPEGNGYAGAESKVCG